MAAEEQNVIDADKLAQMAATLGIDINQLDQQNLDEQTINQLLQLHEMETQKKQEQQNQLLTL